MNLDLQELQSKLRDTFQTDVRKIIAQVKADNLDVVVEKGNGDTATQADLKIGELLTDKLSTWLPASIVVEEESFDRAKLDQLTEEELVWIIDPIDGTKAFRTPGNNEYCVAVALLKDGQPILSSIYAPELEFKTETGLLIEARADLDQVVVNSSPLSQKSSSNWEQLKCINHIHRAQQLEPVEREIADLFPDQEQIRAYEGHSTLIHYCLVAIGDQPQVFTRREASIWDVVQAAYIVEKSGGTVIYPQGEKLLPIDYDQLTFAAETNRLIVPFNLACPLPEVADRVQQKLDE